MAAMPDAPSLLQVSDALEAIVATAAPSVVAVESHRSLSSGFVWRPGLIVTADEALAEDGDISVVLAGGLRVSATVAGRDPTTDIALLRVESTDAPSVPLDAPPLAAGALVVALGARDGTPVAALGIAAMSGPAWRSMRGGEIDARIELALSLRRHSEGGLVLDAAGRAVGMAVFGPRRRVLVIPAATIERVAAQLESRGKVARGYLGLGLQSVRLDRAGGTGAMVMSVDADGPGARAGVQQGDILTAWNGEPVAAVGAILRRLGQVGAGTPVTLSLLRGGDDRTVDLQIGERP